MGFFKEIGRAVSKTVGGVGDIFSSVYNDLLKDDIIDGIGNLAGDVISIVDDDLGRDVNNIIDEYGAEFAVVAGAAYFGPTLLAKAGFTKSALAKSSLAKSKLIGSLPPLPKPPPLPITPDGGEDSFPFYQVQVRQQKRK